MDNTIILTFNFFNNSSFNDIFNYCNRFSEISIKVVQKSINDLVKNNILTHIYSLTNEGIYILNQLNIYYQRIIINSYRKYKIKSDKTYAFKEIRLEQQKLRHYLMSNCPNICSFCEKKLPYFLLETAHIKPRCLLNYYDKNNYNNVIFLCRLCHVIFDKGYLSIFNNELLISDKLNILEYDLPIYTKKLFINEQQIFFDFHFKFIYKS
jgi:predicted restriction endonuclease